MTDALTNFLSSYAIFIPHVLMLSLFSFFYLRVRGMKKHQNALVKELKGLRYWRVNLSRPAYYGKWLRLIAFETKGVLIDDGSAIKILARWPKTRDVFQVAVPKEGAHVEWLGNDSLKTGNIHWARLDTPEGAIFFSADTGLNAVASREALSDIFRSAFPEQALTEEKTRDFALEKNPRSLLAIVLILGLFLFALLDTFVFSNYQLTDAQLAGILRSPRTWTGVGVSLMLLLVLGYRYFMAGRIPSRESLTLALMLSFIALGAAGPVLKRVDQLLAPTPSQNYAYRLSGDSRLEPINTRLGLPLLKFPRMKEYWAQLPKESDYAVPFLRGPLGLWQLDHAQFDPPIRAFYEKEQAKPAAPAKH